MERLATVDTQLEAALKGVSNFRDYQDESRENWKRADKVFTILEAREKTKQEDTNAVRDNLQLHYQANDDRRGEKNLSIARAAMFITLGMALIAGASWYHDYKTPSAQDIAKQTVTEMLKSQEKPAKAATK
jgi:hypothetical protein